jgi:hypothetical protein
MNISVPSWPSSRGMNRYTVQQWSILNYFMDRVEGVLARRCRVLAITL